MSFTMAAAQSASIPGNIASNVERHLRLGQDAGDLGVQLLVFPELSLTGYELDLALSNAIHPEDLRLDPLRTVAASAEMTLVVGAPLLNESGGLHIAAFAFLPDCSVSIYTKEHVHPSEEPVFKSGPGGPHLPLGETKVALAICADASHPAHASKAAQTGAGVYACGAMIDEQSYSRKANLLASYARDHAMTVLLANYSGETGGARPAGRSAIWSEDGELIAASGGVQEELVIAAKRNGAWQGTVLPLP